MLHWVNSLLIWNPATRQAKKLPPPYLLPQGTWPSCFSHGIGYDESTDDYKVVNISKYLKPYHYQTHIYSSRTGSWKNIRFPENCFLEFFASYGKFVNGRLHWMVYKEDANNENRDIVSFDLVEERYKFVGGLQNLPIIGTELNLTDLSGYLSLISSTEARGINGTFKINIWVMMKYGEPQSWAKIWKLEDSVLSGRRVPNAMPLWMLKNGDLAVALRSDVVVYNGQDKLRKTQCKVRDCKIDSAIYFESLASPFSDEEHRRRQ
ncbi:hypothetical protein ACP275_08G087000 [Erythranthe tilingii]